MDFASNFSNELIGFIISILSFIAGWLLGGLYRSLREKWFANKLEKKWGKMKDLTISPKVEDIEYSDGKFKFAK